MPCSGAHSRCLILASATAAGLLFASAPALDAALILDESGFSVNGIVSTGTGGNWRGFEFTTGASAFELGVVKGAWYQTSGYSGATNIQLFTRAGADLTPLSTPVSVPNLSSVSLGTFDFESHAVTVDFSSQSILLSANTAYTILAQHNGSSGEFLGVYRSNTDPVSGSGRLSASASLDDAFLVPGADVPYQAFDTAPVPEPSPLFLLLLAPPAAHLSRRRR